MTDFPILRNLGYIVAAAAVAIALARLVRAPSVVAYMLAGLVIGPVLGVIAEGGTIEVLSEAGIALLLFLVGLELSLGRLRDVGRAAVWAGLLQIVLTVVFGAGIALLFGYPPLTATLLGVILSFSSTVVVVRLLTDQGELTSSHGMIALGILLMQDVVVAAVLAVLAGLGGENIGVASILRGLGVALGGMLALAVVAVIATRWVLPHLFGWGRQVETLFIWSLAWCFLFIVAAEHLGLSIEIGAFIAGVALAQLPYNVELERRLQPLANFFLAVFFVLLGSEIDPVAALDVWPAALALATFVLVGKPLIVMALLPRFDIGAHDAARAAVTLGQASEFGFIVAALAASAGYVTDETMTLVSIVGVVTIGVSAPLVARSEAVASRLVAWGVPQRLGARAEPPERAEVPATGRIIVVGMNTLGRMLVEALARRGEQVLAIDTDPKKLDGLPCAALQGNTDYPRVLESAGLERAKLVISALQIEDANELLAHRCRMAGVPCAIHAFDASLIDELREIGVDYLMVSKHDGIRQVADELRRLEVIV